MVSRFAELPVVFEDQSFLLQIPSPFRAVFGEEGALRRVWSREERKTRVGAFDSRRARGPRPAQSREG